MEQFVRSQRTPIRETEIPSLRSHETPQAWDQIHWLERATEQTEWSAAEIDKRMGIEGQSRRRDPLECKSGVQLAA